MNSETDQLNAIERFTRSMFTHLITALARSLRADDLSVFELAALHQLDREGRMRVGDLASVLDTTLPFTSRLATQLVERGLVERREDETDRRAKVLTLSPAGTALINRTSRERVAAGAEAIGAMPAQLRASFGEAVRQLINRP